MRWSGLLGWLGAVAIVFGLVQVLPLPTPASRIFFAQLILISVFWALLNLIPVIPLDGGRLLQAFLGPRHERRAFQISMVVAVAAAIGLFVVFNSFLFPIFLGMMAYQNWQVLQHYRR